jgi:uncharacterized protein
MKIHLRQIPEDGTHFEGEDPASILELEGTDYTPATPIRYSLDVSPTKDELLFTGQLAIDLHTKCVSCLEPFTFPARVDDFLAQVELEGPEEIDLTPALKEDILLTLPAHPRCDWNGGKQCPGVPRPAPAEDSEDRPNAWGALDQLKIK